MVARDGDGGFWQAGDGKLLRILYRAEQKTEELFSGWPPARRVIHANTYFGRLTLFVRAKSSGIFSLFRTRVRLRFSL